MKIFRMLFILLPLLFRRQLAKRQARLLKKGSSKYDFDKAMQNARIACSYISWAKKVKFKIVNAPTERKYIITPNHTDAYDIIALLQMSPAPTCFVAKIELEKAFLTGPFAKSIGSYFLDRKNLRQSLKTLKRVETEYKDHTHSVTIFPEGTRNDEVGDFQIGAFKTAWKIGAPILPVALLNTKRENKGWNTITLAYGEPIYISRDDKPLDAMNKAHSFVKQTIASFKEDNQKPQ